MILTAHSRIIAPVDLSSKLNFPVAFDSNKNNRDRAWAIKKIVVKDHDFFVLEPINAYSATSLAALETLNFKVS